MVKVVGKDETAVQRITCRNCASILEYTPSETERYDGKDYSGGSAGKIWIDCPNCGHEVVIKSW